MWSSKCSESLNGITGGEQGNNCEEINNQMKERVKDEEAVHKRQHK